MGIDLSFEPPLPVRHHQHTFQMMWNTWEIYAFAALCDVKSWYGLAYYDQLLEVW